MIDELFLYDRDTGLFKQVLDQSATIQGRYFVAPHGTEDLNTANLSQYIESATQGVTVPDQKYPMVLCLAPRSQVRESVEVFSFNLLFLVRNGINDINSDSMISMRNAWKDWNQMHSVGVQFIRKLNSTIKAGMLNGLPYKSFMGIVNDSVDIFRFTSKSNDNLNGARLNFRMEISVNCETPDYEQI